MWNGITEEEALKIRGEDKRMECLRLASSKPDVSSPEAIVATAQQYERFVFVPQCEMDEKVAILKQVAKIVGVELSSVFPASE